MTTKGMAALIKRILTGGKNIQEIAEATGISEKEIQSLAEAKESQQSQQRCKAVSIVAGANQQSVRSGTEV